MKICVLASGSSGNCIYAGAGSTHILIDAGLSGTETARRLEQAGLKLADIAGVCLTHEHGDHIAGLKVLHTRHGIPLYANSGTVEGVCKDAGLNGLTWKIFTTGAPFQIGALQLEPFAVSHDAYEPVGFIVTGGEARVGVVTDIGVVTHLVRERLRHCRALIVESNHDERLLADARRPWLLKQRIAGRQGHLSNEHAAELISELAGPDLQQVFLAHLSADCNRPELACQAAQAALRRKGQPQVRVQLTYPDRISEVWSAAGTV
jgi:phosphoribosyl 1,2-cyclic phosphodiesterase